MRTYLIEPQNIFVPFLSRVLAEAGLHIVATSEEVDARDIAAKAPAAIFVDVDFFERGAPNALCRIRQVAKDVALIAYSGAEDPTFEAACYISGASAVVSKRAGVEALVKTVRDLFRGMPVRVQGSPLVEARP